ncbi:MAG: hypothetical protein LBT76_03250, partial [Tannerella sp.]|nr:hypothetical protein [Tannerella sp.]
FGTVKSEFGTVNLEFGTVNLEFGTVKSEFRTVKSEFGTVKLEFRTANSEFGTVKLEFGTANSELLRRKRSFFGRMAGSGRGRMACFRRIYADSGANFAERESLTIPRSPCPARTRPDAGQVRRISGNVNLTLSNLEF